jgi:hypothetical protein
MVIDTSAIVAIALNELVARRKGTGRVFLNPALDGEMAG